VLDDDAARYVAKVHRLCAGDTFRAFDPERVLEAEARITLVRKQCVQCEIGPVQPAQNVPGEPRWLLVGVCKDESFRATLREATALGATNIVPVQLTYSRSVGPRPDAKRVERWRRIVVQGARQSGRGDVPRLHEPVGLGEALERVPQQEDFLRLCPWEKASSPVGPVLRQNRERRGVALLVGPAGGLSPEETAAAFQAAFHVVSLGPLVLRTETAVVAILGAWHLRG